MAQTEIRKSLTTVTLVLAIALSLNFNLNMTVQASGALPQRLTLS